MSTDAGTPTPRTDKAAYKGDYDKFLCDRPELVAASFARQLERELTALRAAHEAAQAEIAALRELEKELLQVILALPQTQFEKFRHILSKHRDITLPIEKELEAARKAK